MTTIKTSFEQFADAANIATAGSGGGGDATLKTVTKGTGANIVAKSASPIIGARYAAASTSTTSTTAIMGFDQTTTPDGGGGAIGALDVVVFDIVVRPQGASTSGSSVRFVGARNTGGACFRFSLSSGMKLRLLNKSDITVKEFAPTIATTVPLRIAGWVRCADAAVAASLLTGVVASNNGIRWTAVTAGTGGNAITVQILGSTGNNVTLSVGVVGNAITVTPATDGSGVITSTASQVITAVTGHAPAAALVGVANELTSTGAGLVAATGPTALSGGKLEGAAHIEVYTAWDESTPTETYDCTYTDLFNAGKTTAALGGAFFRSTATDYQFGILANIANQPELHFDGVQWGDTHPIGPWAGTINDPPTIDTTTATIVHSGEIVHLGDSLELSFTATDADAISWSLTDEPTNSSVDMSAYEDETTGIFTPTHMGFHQITATITSTGNKSDSHTWDVLVLANVTGA